MSVEPPHATSQHVVRLVGVGCERDARRLLAPTDLTLASGELVALLGANGAGKTTLLRCALGLERHASGRATIDGMAVRRLAPRQRARLAAYLPQQRPLAWPVRVRDVVALGRYAWGGSRARPSGRDAAAIERAIARCRLSDLAERRTDTLSGGELARVHCARALAGETPLLFADEPVAELDPRHQYEVMGLLRRYVDGGNGALVVLHEVSLAARYADRLVWLREGEVVADGPVRETLTADRLREVYGVEADVLAGPAEAPGGAAPLQIVIRGVAGADTPRG